MQIPVLVSHGFALLAQVTLPSGGGSTQPTGSSWLPESIARAIASVPPLMLLAIPLLLMVFLSSRSKKNQERAERERMNAIKRGDQVQTIGGVIGKVVEIEESRIRLKVDEGNNTKIWFSRTAIQRVVEEDKEKSIETK